MKVTLKDYKNDVKPDWCAGCGDFSVLAGINRTVVNLGIKPENVVISAGLDVLEKLVDIQEHMEFKDYTDVHYQLLKG